MVPFDRQCCLFYLQLPVALDGQRHLALGHADGARPRRSWSSMTSRSAEPSFASPSRRGTTGWRWSLRSGTGTNNESHGQDTWASLESWSDGSVGRDTTGDVSLCGCGQDPWAGAGSMRGRARDLGRGHGDHWVHARAWKGEQRWGHGRGIEDVGDRKSVV